MPTRWSLTKAFENVGGYIPVSDAWPVRRYAHGYLPSCRTSLIIGWYPIILPDNRGTYVWTTCPGHYARVTQPGVKPSTSRSRVESSAITNSNKSSATAEMADRGVATATTSSKSNAPPPARGLPFRGWIWILNPSNTKKPPSVLKKPTWSVWAFGHNTQRRTQRQTHIHTTSRISRIATTVG